MNYLRTAILLAGLTALFMGVGFLIGGQTGAMIALVVAAAMNLFSYWNSDRMVLSMHGAQEVDQSTAPDLVDLVGGPRRARRPADAARLHHGQPAAERVRDRPQSGERGGRRDHRPDGAHEPRGARRRHCARARAHQEPRHADHDDHRDDCRRDLHAGAVRHVLRRRPPRQQQRRRHGHHRHAGDGDPRADRRHAGADGDQPDARIRRRQSRRAHRRPAGLARLGAGASSKPRRTPSRTRTQSAAPRPRTCSSSIR